MADFNTAPEGRGTGAAVTFGDSSGLGALKYLINQDKMKATIAGHQAKAAAQAQAAAAKDFASRMKLSDKGGLTYLPQLQTKAQGVYTKMQEIANTAGLSPQEKVTQQQQLRDQFDREAEASAQVDKHVGDLAQRVAADNRFDRDATWNLLHSTQYKDGQLLSPLDYDPRSADAALGTGRAHLNGVEIMKQFAAADPPPDSISYNVEALPGGRGTRRTATSNYFELTPEGGELRDPKTNLRVIKSSPEALSRFDRDAVNRQYLDSYEADHQQELASATQKMQQYQELTPAEAATVAREQSPAGRRLDLFKNLLTEMAYGRESTTLTNKAAPRPHVGRATAAPKFTLTGGSDYGPELIGGTGVGGTRGLTALAASDPLKRVKADGTAQDFEAEGLHRQFIRMQNGSPEKLITNNAASQRLRYIKPALFLTSSTGNVVTPANPALLAAYQQGNRQPLFDWLRAERERDPKLTFQYHFLAAPAKGAKLTAGNNADDIYKRLRAADSNKPDDTVRATAQKMAEQESASLLIPYKGEDLRAIDSATGYHLRNPKQSERMKKELEYFTSQTAPRPAEARATVAKKAIGIDFGTAPTAKPTSTPPAPPVAPIKRAGTKKTGISF